MLQSGISWRTWVSGPTDVAYQRWNVAQGIFQVCTGALAKRVLPELADCCDAFSRFAPDQEHDYAARALSGS